MSQREDPTEIKILCGSPKELQTAVNEALCSGWSLLSGPIDAGSDWKMTYLVITIGLFPEEEKST